MQRHFERLRSSKLNWQCLKKLLLNVHMNIFQLFKRYRLSEFLSLSQWDCSVGGLKSYQQLSSVFMVK